MSTVTSRAADGGDALPAASVATAVSACAPCVRFVAANVHVSPVTVASPSFVAPSKTATVVPAVVVPPSVAVRSTTALSIAGDGGATVSITTRPSPASSRRRRRRCHPQLVPSVDDVAELERRLQPDDEVPPSGKTCTQS